MTTVAAIRELGDVPGSQLNDPFQAYAKGGSNVPRGIKANPILYGELTRHYLQWSAALLSTIEQAASARVACQPAVGRLMECASAYFADSTRWPDVSHLQHPLRLLMPRT